VVGFQDLIAAHRSSQHKIRKIVFEGLDGTEKKRHNSRRSKANNLMKEARKAS